MKKLFLMLSAFILCSAAFGQSKWFKAQSKSASVKSVTATSELVEAQFDGKYLYPPINILDGDFNSTWCEADQKGSGIGESITVEFAEPVSFDEIQIVNGFVSKDYYLKNNRVKTLRLTQVAKEHFQQKDYTLKDNVQDWQSIKFDLLQTAQTLTLEIREVYKGSKYDDTCLDDIRLLYKGKVIPFENVENLKLVQSENSKQMLNTNQTEFKKQFDSLFVKMKGMIFSPDNCPSYIYLLADDGSNDSLIINGEYTIFSGGKIFDSFEKAKNYGSNFDRHFTEKTIESFFESNSTDIKTKYKYYVGGRFEYSWFYGGGRYTLGNSRIIHTRNVDYVEVKTVTLLKIDGDYMFVNGVKYKILKDGEVFDARIEFPE